MRIGIVNTFDLVGGAAKASLRLRNGLNAQGTNAKMLVRTKQSDDSTIVCSHGYLKGFKDALINRVDNLPLALYPNRTGPIFSVGLIHSNSLKKYFNSFDVFNVNWIAGAFQSINSISKISKPIVLTLHDSWSYTGGCHIPFDCSKFKNDCGECPQLQSKKKKDLSYYLQQKKKKLWTREDMIVVGGSNWIANNAKQSAIFKNHRVEVIHPGLNLNVYKPLNKAFCRETLNIDLYSKVIVFGAVNSTSDFNKGFHLLLPALKYLLAEDPNLQLLVFGASEPSEQLDILANVKYLGKINDEALLAVLYASADVVIVPSMQESFGQTASESMACGTPVVAFDTSGLKDIIDHKINGFLAKPFDSEDLAKGISWVLSNPVRHVELGKAAREKAVKAFDISISVQKYTSLFEELHAKYNIHE